MPDKVTQAQRLFGALRDLTDHDTAYPLDASSRPQTQAIVDHLALLAEDSAVRDTLREPIGELLARWRERARQLDEQLQHARAELRRVENARHRLQHFASGFRGESVSRLRASA